MGVGGDATNWDEENYRRYILQERELRFRTVFRSIFAPSQNPKPDILVVASGDGSLASYSLASCISSKSAQLNKGRRQQSSYDFSVAEPLFLLQGHNGPAYDVKFYGNGEDSLLLSCGDDGRIRGWRWKEILESGVPVPGQANNLNPVLDLVNPQHEGPWGALSPIPENNAIAVDTQGGSVVSAAGDSCAYLWDVVCISSRRQAQSKWSSRGIQITCIALLCINQAIGLVKNSFAFCILNIFRHGFGLWILCQIITGSEDGTARIWDCRSGKCSQIISPENNPRSKDAASWVSSIAIDASESWLACGSGRSLSIWSLPSAESILRLDTHAAIQDVLFDNNHILAVGAEPFLTRFNISGTVLSQIQCAPQSAFSVSLHPSGVTSVGGYGGLVDVISEFGSHLCTFRCRGI